MYGLIENMRPEFRRALRPLKGGTAGVAEILRASNAFASASPKEEVYVHLEQRRSDQGADLDLDLGNIPGMTFYIEGYVSPALVAGDVLKVSGVEYSIQQAPLTGNLTPGDVVQAVRR